jgi:hypothetical protein
MKKKYRILLLVLSVSIFVCIGLFLMLGLGFRNAIVDSGKGVYEMQKEWQNEGISPIDTIKTQIIELVDSSESK